VTESASELQALADLVVARARPSELVEAFVMRGGETEVRVYEGDVEHFVSAQSEGIGIRVIRDGRTGFAYAGAWWIASLRNMAWNLSKPPSALIISPI
jgi:PmbA protein